MQTLTAQKFEIRTHYILVAICSGAALTWLCSLVRIPLPFTPVPLTLQTFSVLLVGALLGKRLGGISQTAYVIAGAAGLPVFAHAGAGVAALMGPTGGYLLGFVASAFLLGKLFAQDRTYSTGEIAWRMLLGLSVIFALGLTQLWIVTRLSLAQIFTLGLWPFLPGAMIKLCLAISFFRVLHKPIRKWGRT